MSSEVTMGNIYIFLVASQLKLLSSASFLRVFSTWEYGGTGGGMAEETAQLTGWMACHETTLTEGQELVDVYSIF